MHPHLHGLVAGSSVPRQAATTTPPTTGPERDLLSAVLEQALLSVTITDGSGAITYVNAAFERITGARRPDVMATYPRVMAAPGRRTSPFHSALWATLSAGGTWHGEFVNRRTDGVVFTEQGLIAPVMAPDGSFSHYVIAMREISADQTFAAQRAVATDVSSIGPLLAELTPGDTAETTAAAICERVLTLPGISFALLARFLPGDRTLILGSAGRDRVPIPAVDRDRTWTPAMRRRIRRLRSAMATGPLLERGVPSVASWIAPSLVRLGVRALAEVPVSIAGSADGFLQVGSSDPGAAGILRALMPTIGEFGSVATLLVGPQIDVLARSDLAKRPIRKIIDGFAFRSVFQPIVSMTDGRVLGYEALTRFTDRTPPAEMFAVADQVGLGVELELATLEAAVIASRTLPPDAWLDLNVSPALLGHPVRLSHVLWKVGGREIVLEMTEHQAIDNYRLLRNSLDELGVPVRLAVDDAGAGYASLRHILELRPDIIKLDRSLVTGIDRDPARQGLVAGLQHFAISAGAVLVAEGVQTRSERRTLLTLGVELGQGYLLGRPVSAARVRRPGPTVIPDAEPEPGVAVLAGPADLVHRVNAILWEADGRAATMTFVSEGAQVLTGHATTRWLTEPRFWESHVDPRDRVAVLAAIAGAVADGRDLTLEYRFRLADGQYRWFEDRIEFLPGANGTTRLVGVMIDITERRGVQDDLAHQATHDPLTGLRNRKGLDDRLARMSSSGSEAHGVLYVDLDDFKAINDHHGHRTGDHVLGVVADRLRTVTRETDVLARMGGDEFVIIARVTGPSTIVALGERLLAALEQPVVIDGKRLAVSASLGIAVATRSDTSDTLLRKADLAMYAAKNAGGGRLVVFEPHQMPGEGADRRSELSTRESAPMGPGHPPIGGTGHRAAG